MRYLTVTIISLTLGLGALAAAPANGTIQGVIRDSSKQILPGVTVTATDKATNTRRLAYTNEFGEYKLEVPPGTYEVTASLLGFQPEMLTDLTVLEGRTMQVELKLKINFAEPLSLMPPWRYVPLEGTSPSAK